VVLVPGTRGSFPEAPVGRHLLFKLVSTGWLKMKVNGAAKMKP